MSRDLQILLLPCTSFDIVRCVLAHNKLAGDFARAFATSHALRSVMDMNAVAPGLTMVELRQVLSPFSLLSN
jgi:hypothetical protein